MPMDSTPPSPLLAPISIDKEDLVSQAMTVLLVLVCLLDSNDRPRLNNSRPPVSAIEISTRRQAIKGSTLPT